MTRLLILVSLKLSETYMVVVRRNNEIIILRTCTFLFGSIFLFTVYLIMFVTSKVDDLHLDEYHFIQKKKKIKKMGK